MCHGLQRASLTAARLIPIALTVGCANGPEPLAASANIAETALGPIDAQVLVELTRVESGTACQGYDMLRSLAPVAAQNEYAPQIEFWLLLAPSLDDVTSVDIGMGAGACGQFPPFLRVDADAGSDQIALSTGSVMEYEIVGSPLGVEVDRSSMGIDLHGADGCLDEGFPDVACSSLSGSTFHLEVAGGLTPQWSWQGEKDADRDDDFCVPSGRVNRIR